MNRTSDDTDQPSQWLRHRSLVTCLLLALAAWHLYLPSIQFNFVNFDDVRILREHPELYGQASLSADLRAIFVSGFPREEPLPIRDASWALDSRIFGFGNPFGYHLGNVILHGLVVALLFAFLFGTTRRYGFSLAIAAAFLVLAIHTEAVAWIMGRKDLLSSIFMLLALCAQTKRLQTESIPAQCGWHAVTLACFAGGLLSKINVLSFPIVLLLHAVLWPYLNGEREPGAPFLWGRAVKRELALLALNVAPSVLVFIWYSRTLAQMGVFDRGYTAHGLRHVWNLLMVNPPAFLVYLRQTFFPHNLKVLYTWPELCADYPVWQVAVSLGTMAGAGGLGVWLFLRRKDVFFYYGAFFILMAPYMNLIYIGIWVAERYLYFPSFCLLAMAVSAAIDALRGPSRIARFGVLAVITICVARNLLQGDSYQKVWRNGETLWQYHAGLPSPSPLVYSILASWHYNEAKAREGSEQMAISMRKMAIVVAAGLEKFCPNRGKAPPETYHLFFQESIVREMSGEPEAALESLLTCERLRPGFDSAKLNLARLYRKLSKAAEDPRLRRTYARNARDRLAQYIAIDFRNRPAPPEIRLELADLEAECEISAQPAGMNMDSNKQ